MPKELRILGVTLPTDRKSPFSEILKGTKDAFCFLIFAVRPQFFLAGTCLTRGYSVLRAKASSPHANYCQLLCGHMWEPRLMLICIDTSPRPPVLHLENDYQAEIGSRDKDGSV